MNPRTNQATLGWILISFLGILEGKPSSYLVETMEPGDTSGIPSGPFPIPNPTKDLEVAAEDIETAAEDVSPQTDLEMGENAKEVKDLLIFLSIYIISPKTTVLLRSVPPTPLELLHHPGSTY